MDDVPFLRHTLATLAYRGGKTLRGAPESFATFRTAAGARTPVEILAHIGDLLDWAVTITDGQETWHDSPPLAWPDEVARFFAALGSFDTRLASGAALKTTAEGLFQGPIADAFTHVGQIAMLRRLAGSPIRGENYQRARIAIGQVGAEQAEPRREFD